MSITSLADCRDSGFASFYRHELWGFDFGEFPWIDPPFLHGESSSFWIGNFPCGAAAYYLDLPWDSFSCDDLNESCPFWDDLGSNVSPEEFAGHFQNDSVPVAELIEQLPEALRHREEIVELSHSTGIREGNALFLIRGMQYFGQRSFAFGYVRFIGYLKHALQGDEAPMLPSYDG